MFSRDREAVERREVSCFASSFDVELGADAPDKFRDAAFCGKHPGEKKQIACLHRFHIGAERFGRRREFDTEIFQSLLGAGRLRVFTHHHLPRCAPPSTCSTSPVIWRASVRYMTALAISSTVEIVPIGESVFRTSFELSA